MKAFQLYRTNLYLGGQMKMDVVLDNIGSSLYVSNFHLTPISNNIPYTYKSEDTLLNNKHQDNVKAFYNSIKGYFYNEGLDPEFTHNWPIISDVESQPNIYSNIYDMGCKRTKHYSVYNKQFEFLCPLWIEQLDRNSKIVFKLTLYGIDDQDNATDNIVASKSFTIDFNTVTNYLNHDKFVKYFYNYLEDAGLFEGSDDLVNIKFNNLSASITGLDVSNGIFTTKHSDALTINLTSRERPLMEADNMIVESLKNNTIICKQLFNFNICFDLSDIFTINLLNKMAGKRMSANMEVFIDEKPLEFRDFYTEYEFIDKHILHNSEEENLDFSNVNNVLDYLQDNNSIDLINKNKFAQNVIHWSLADNNEYLFNVYNGFAGLYVDYSLDSVNPYFYENLHQYKNAPNTALKYDNAAQNTSGWLELKSVNKWNDFYKYVVNENKRIEGTHITKDTKYINNIKYLNLKNVIDTTEDNKEVDFYLLGLLCTPKLFTIIIDSFKNDNSLVFEPINNLHDTSKTTLFALKIDKLIIILGNSRIDFSFGKMFDTLKLFVNADSTIYDNESVLYYIKKLYDIMQNKMDPELVLFNNSLAWTYANGPSKEIEEISYIKQNVSEYVLRYDGKIKPTLVPAKDFAYSYSRLYYKDFVSDIKNNNNETNLQKSNYVKYMNSGFEPLYPSLNYYAINNVSNWSYSKLPKVSVTETKLSNTADITLLPSIEYSWFNDSKILTLLNALHFVKEVKITDANKTYKEILTDIIQNYISEFYNVTDIKSINYIISKYNIHNNWNYISDTSVKDYKYDITMILK